MAHEFPRSDRDGMRLTHADIMATVAELSEVKRSIMLIQVTAYLCHPVSRGVINDDLFLKAYEFAFESLNVTAIRRGE